MSKVDLIKYLLFFVKIHAFIVKKIDMLRNEILKKQTKNTNFNILKFKQENWMDYIFIEKNISLCL